MSQRTADLDYASWNDWRARDYLDEYYAEIMPNLARLVVNGDPCVEYIYEPWGGYPATGTNTVSHWHRKYLRSVQVVSPA